jgi:polysaccharide export outer membrane protein
VPGAAKAGLLGQVKSKERVLKNRNHQGRFGASVLRKAAGLAAVGVTGVLGGCQNSFMDPSINGSGRWKATPAVMPILDRLATIEDETGELVETSDPVAADLIPLPQSYRIGPGDSLEITLYDLIETGRPEKYSRTVDPRGTLELPQLGRLSVGGMTTEEATEVIRTAMKRLVAEPLVLVDALGQRQQTYNIIGEVQSPGPYFIPRADYRLLEALNSGGRFDQNAEEIFVIRQVPLTDEVTRGQTADPNAPTNVTPVTPTDPNQPSVLDTIDIIAPEKPAEPAPQPSQPSEAPESRPIEPSPTSPAPAPSPAPATQPPPPPPIPLPGEPVPPRMGMFAQPESQPGQAPIVKLPENEPARQGQPAEAIPQGQNDSWIFVNGKWVRASERQARPGSTPSAADQDLITQRIIRIPLQRLLAGEQSVNIIIRPGDVIRVPSPPSGLIYVGGQVARPGVYQLPSTGGVSLMRVIVSAGGYGNLAIPSRVDITRIVGKNREATIMLDGEAIANRTQPDVWLKPNDHINVGTTWWALPLAVIRNGFRASYGFGFVLDRNISNDLFGPPPLNALGQ